MERNPPETIGKPYVLNISAQHEILQQPGKDQIGTLEA